MANRVVATFGAAVLAWGIHAHADSWNERTVLTFTVMIPGATLPPGTDVVRSADARAAHHTIRLHGEDEATLISTFISLPVRRTTPSDGIVVTFDPASQDKPVAMKGWYDPGRLHGAASSFGPREKERFGRTQDAGDHEHCTDVKVGQSESLDGHVMQMPGGVPTSLMRLAA